MNQCRAFRNFYLRSFIRRWVDDVVRVKMYLPFWLWIYVHQNVWCYSPHICQHSPPLGSIFLFIILKGFQVRMMKECWAIEKFYLISFTWMWGNDLVLIMVYVPFFIWKFVYQNICWYSPHILTTLATTGFSISFCNFKRIPSKDHKGMLSIWEVLFKVMMLCSYWRLCTS